VILSSAAGIALFLVISALLARVFSLDGAEQSAISSLISAEARGDAPGVIARIRGCAQSPACRVAAAGHAARLAHPGATAILRLDASAGFALTSTVGTARVVWRIGAGRPIVQCIRVRRAGDVLSGFTIELLAVSRRIFSDSSCPSSF
jgi:hypothetical protein